MKFFKIFILVFISFVFGLFVSFIQGKIAFDKFLKYKNFEIIGHEMSYCGDIYLGNYGNEAKLFALIHCLDTYDKTIKINSYDEEYLHDYVVASIRAGLVSKLVGNDEMMNFYYKKALEKIPPNGLDPWKKVDYKIKDIDSLIRYVGELDSIAKH